MIARFLFPIWYIAKKDLQVWLLHPLLIVSSLLVPLSYFLVVFGNAQATGRNPVAVVNQDQGGVGKQIVNALVQSDVFRVQQVDALHARDLYNRLEVAAIITLHPDFSQRVNEHRSAPVDVLVRNNNLDISNDVHRSVPDAITDYYQSLGSRSPIRITMDVNLMRAHDIQLFQYSVLPIIILIVTVNGIITSGMATTGEWEKRTIKEVLLAPCGPLSLILGKVLAGFLSTCSIAVGMLVLGSLFGVVQIQGVYWLSALAIIVLSSLFSSGLGIAVGTFFRRKQPVSYAATLAAVELFALAGGLGVIFFEPQWLQSIAQYDPLTYAIHTLQQAVFYASFDHFLRDAAVLSGATVLTVASALLAMRKELEMQ